MSSHPFEFMRLPFGLLIALDSRMFHFWIQPIHFLLRILHLLSMAVFFGMVLMLQGGIWNRKAHIPLRPVTELVLPWLHWSFAVCMVTGVLLFFYDPVHVGSRGYFTPKLLLMAIAMTLGWFGHRRTLKPTLLSGVPASRESRVTAMLSMVLWAGVVICSCLNTEGVPKVFLR
ncbi:hypothetical protein [Rhizosaccharibacter radicis]|uniref:Cytochrome b561 bacterial/Ni-hydrogenase domain-containing protein n=1 Tax=Rhizosaccharibacter radicis TaxID=2782605 RepID=A0ABT1VXQ5_9PROT|nr:hypothetical protein [Acetobacteraceae bacterium KSS12]